MNNNKCLKTFSLRDKLLFRSGFYGFIIVGTLGISTLESIYLGMAYLAYSIIGLFFGAFDRVKLWWLEVAMEYLSPFNRYPFWTF